MISWVNPRAELAHKSFEDYMREGILEALDAIEQATGERGQLSSATASAGPARRHAWPTWQHRGQPDQERYVPATLRLQRGGRASCSWTRSRSRMESTWPRKAISRATRWRAAFNLLRSNDLIWPYVVDVYMKGRDAAAVRPAVLELGLDAHAVHDASFYWCNMYQKNLLVQPGGIIAKGVPIDILGRIKTPATSCRPRTTTSPPWALLPIAAA